MTVEFGPFSQDEQPDDVLPGPTGPTSHRRRWITIACAAMAAALLAGGGVAIAQDSSSGPGQVAAGTSATSTATSTASPKARPFERGPMKPLLFGTVKSASGTTIVITDYQGFTRTIVTSSKTVYKNGMTADPKAGTKIVAQGTVDANGTSLDATLITTGPSFGGPGGGHPGFGGGHGGFGGFGGPNGKGPRSFPSGVHPSGAPNFHPGSGTGKPPAPPTGPTTPPSGPTA